MPWTRLKLAVCLSLASIGGVTEIRSQETATLTADRSEFILVISPERMLRSQELVGARFQMQSGDKATTIRLDRIKRTQPIRGRPIVLHEIVIETTTGKWLNPCRPDTSGERWGLPMLESDGRLSFACLSGAIAKCVLWGYPPWSIGADDVPMPSIHRACVHLVRADYGGTGITAARAGTLIRFCDRFGINKCGFHKHLLFEAIWDAEGARCIANLRNPQVVSLQKLVANSPRLKGRIGRKVCVSSFKENETLLMSYSLRR